MKRITPEEVVEAFKTTGLKPKRREYFKDDNTCACGLGIICFVNGIKSADGASEYTEQKYGLQYRRGFAKGFDGEESNVNYCSEDRYVIGCQDGKAAWQACVDNGLTEG